MEHEALRWLYPSFRNCFGSKVLLRPTVQLSSSINCERPIQHWPLLHLGVSNIRIELLAGEVIAPWKMEARRRIDFVT